jgi:ubiquinone/menaquinone biosynthesis C-methylase UbiE
MPSENRFETIDQAYRDYLAQHETMPDRWLLAQTLNMAPVRRAIMGYVPIPPHSRVLDAGTGFGALALELASQIPVHIEALDIDAHKLAIARQIGGELEDKGHLQGTVTFTQGDIYRLPYPDQSFDFMIAWYLYQHLEDPAQATREMYRVLRPGGQLYVVDIDDQLVLAYPEISDAFRRLHEALCEAQRRRGGDRYIGRKLPLILHREGFVIAATAIQQQAQYFASYPDDAERMGTVQFFMQAREDILRFGILTGEQFDHYIQEYRKAEPHWKFGSNAQVIVLGRRPAPTP